MVVEEDRQDHQGIHRKVLGKVDHQAYRKEEEDRQDHQGFHKWDDKEADDKEADDREEDDKEDNRKDLLACMASIHKMIGTCASWMFASRIPP